MIPSSTNLRMQKLPKLRGRTRAAIGVQAFGRGVLQRRSAAHNHPSDSLEK
jgi:hypothetical protein